MKNLLPSLSFLLIALLLSSCSQSEVLSSQATENPTYAYHRVYQGNKVIFRNLDENDSKELLALENLKEIVGDEEEWTALPSEVKGAEEQLNTQDDKSAWNPKSLGKRFSRNLRSIHQSGMAGHFLANTLNLPSSRESGAEDDASSISNGQIFALIGFIFGLLSFLGSFWVAGAVVGIVFSILGWDSEWHIFALLGLIFSVAGIVLYVFLR